MNEIGLSIALFIIGLLFLFFGKFKNVWNDITGFCCVIIAYLIILLQL